jgi:glycosyltransferase involved in cell wall biosynthesis
MIWDDLMGTTPTRPRLIMLTQWFDPEPTLKGAKFAQRLHDLGFDVEVVTGFPNYPGGAVYPGYRIRPFQRETVGNVAVTRLALYPSHDQSRFGRILNYVSFFVSAVCYLIFAARKANVVYVYHPPLTVGMAAVVAKFFRRTPIVLDIQDLWPDTLRATGMIGNQRLLRLVDRVCSWTYKRVDHISVLSNGFRDLLVKRGVPTNKVSVIHNWADEPEEEGVEDEVVADPLGPRGPFRLLFAGNMGKAQGLDNVLDAAALALAAHRDIEFCLLGSGLDLDRLKARAAAENLTNVRFLPRVPLSRVGAYLDAADCLLVHLKADPLFKITVPSKTQAYLRAGRPIIMAVPGDAADLVCAADAGLAISSDDPEALVDAVVAMAAQPETERERLGHNAQVYYAEELSFAKGTGRFGELLGALAGGARR